MNSSDRRIATRVGVYGTLKQGQSNHRVLSSAQYVGCCRLDQITLYEIGPYPGAKLRPSHGIDVEVYDVNDAVFAQLDELEDYNPQSPQAGEYDRRQLRTPYGSVWVYIYNPGVRGLPEISKGGWPPNFSGAQ